TNGVSKTFIDSYLPYEIKDLIDDVNTSNSQKLSNFVSIPTYSNNSIKIQLKNNIGKYKFIPYQTITNDILITSNEILLNNIQLPTNVTPQESPEDWFTWDSNGNQITGLSDIGLNQKRIVLPSKATSISNDAFYKNESLVSVDMSLTKITSIPNGINNGVGIFRQCLNIISISLPSSLISIGYGAFANCTSLTSINIPDDVTLIEAYTFANCSSLTSINIPDDVTSIGNSVFNSCISLTSINIPDGVTSIGYYAFRDCSSLTSITIPDGVTSIGTSAFDGCTSLTSITMPNSVVSIGTSVFMNVPSTCVMNASSTWNQTLAINAGYKGTFNIISSSTKY
ncbi:MAG: leucine-rich repeat domain-containing protein, partial [Ureaplasma sp.]|nr:leucine-rich repeat domain-containing protein [Ureaplasma sp.]